MVQSKNRINSFKHAFRGIFNLYKTQKNARIHALATIIVLAAGFYFGFTKTEWCLIVLTISAVWIAEAFNTALEYLADACSPELHPLVGKAKDMAAGAVLISALASIIIGILIICPYILRTFIS
jgi:diacylglycerol kinase (ATP)